MTDDLNITPHHHDTTDIRRRLHEWADGEVAKQKAEDDQRAQDEADMVAASKARLDALMEAQRERMREIYERDGLDTEA